MEKYFRGYNNNLFKFRVTPKSEVTAFVGGYIITPDGEFVPIERDEKHVIIFNKYINEYLGKSRDKIVASYLGVSEDSEDIETLDFYSAYGLLISLGHVIYSGLGVSNDNKSVNLILPSDYESSLTNEQRNSCVMFLLSEKLEEMDDVTICLWNSEEEMTTSEFLNKISISKSM